MDYDSSQTSNGNTNPFFLHLLIIYLCPSVFLFQLSLASVSIWFTRRLSFSKACCCSPRHCYSSFLRPSVSILVCDSLFPSPLFHSVCHFASLSLPSCPFFYPPFHRYPNAFILPPLPIHSICFSLQCCQHFRVFPSLQLPLPPLLFHSLSPHYFLTAMFLCCICQARCFTILLAYGELSLL